jgi:hypothetical protein
MKSKLSVALAACALLGATEAKTAPLNPFVVTIEQVGPNVVATGSGEFDVTGLISAGGVSDGGEIFPAHPSIFLSSGTLTIYSSSGSGPANFGPGGTSSDSSESGSGLTFAFFPSVDLLSLGLPPGYTSGTALSDQDIFDNTTLAMLGITPGTYVWTWGGTTEADQSFTIDVVSSTPLPAALPLFATGLGMMGWIAKRRKRKNEAALAAA